MSKGYWQRRKTTAVDGNVHAASTQSKHCSSLLFSHLRSPTFLAFFILIAFTLDLLCWIEGPIRSNRMLTSLIRALRGPYQVRVSFAWGTSAVPIGGFEELSVVCFCFTATVGKCWPTLLEHTEVMGNSLIQWMTFMSSGTSGASSRIMINGVTQTLITSVALKNWNWNTSLHIKIVISLFTFQILYFFCASDRSKHTLLPYLYLRNPPKKVFLSEETSGLCRNTFMVKIRCFCTLCSRDLCLLTDLHHWSFVFTLHNEVSTISCLDLQTQSS